jgi:hypothetical protein
MTVAVGLSPAAEGARNIVRGQSRNGVRRVCVDFKKENASLSLSHVLFNLNTSYIFSIAMLDFVETHSLEYQWYVCKLY